MPQELPFADRKAALVVARSVGLPAEFEGGEFVIKSAKSEIRTANLGAFLAFVAGYCTFSGYSHG
jgi:hypothetical protein